MVRNMGGGMGNMMKAAQKMQKQMMQAQEELKDKYVEGEAGGGMVKAVVNGQKELIKITIDKDFALKEVEDEDDVATLEDLVTAAVRNGMEKAGQLMEDSMGKLTGGMNIPGMF
ncbi:YbaB/EbfC family nucleoid-associated protein [Planctomycetota bacterium]